jgi:LAGLIDADG endonuclease.
MSSYSASNNQTRADNQQERLINIGWIIGFVDGEGCFSIGFIKQSGGINNQKGYKTGYQVSHEFVVTQGEKSLESLVKLQSFFGVGQIIINRRYDNHKEHLYRYVVRKREDLLRVIVPFFEQNKLQTAKFENFVKFVKCINIINQNLHLTKDGLIKIAEITQTMNNQKSRSELIRILRDYTPNAQNPMSEDIVPSVWRHTGSASE